MVKLKLKERKAKERAKMKIKEKRWARSKREQQLWKTTLKSIPYRL